MRKIHVSGPRGPPDAPRLFVVSADHYFKDVIVEHNQNVNN